MWWGGADAVVLAERLLDSVPFPSPSESKPRCCPLSPRARPACREGTPQCFLLTPKLLPDLPFTRDVTVLQIMNGSHIKDVSARCPSWSLPACRRRC